MTRPLLALAAAALAAGSLVGAWRIRIDHQPLRTGRTVAITGVALQMRLRTGRALASRVVGGSVTVANRGASCTNQVYAVQVQLASGAFTGTSLRHLRGDDQRARASLAH